MDKGALFKNQFDITPVESGFLVLCDRKTYAFSNIADLMRWLQFHAAALPQQQKQESSAELKARLKEKHGDTKPLALPDLTQPPTAVGRLKNVFGL